MSFSNSKVPSLIAIRAFEAAARHGSFTLAAKELHVTQSAISRQVQALEDEMGVTLFVRRGPRLMLTEPGGSFASASSAAFEVLRSATQRLRYESEEQRRPQANTITLGMLASLAAKWFTPRLPGLLATMPNLDLRISASRKVQDLQADAIDCAIRYGLGHWPGVRAELLMTEELIVAASPDLSRRLCVGSPEDLIDQTLLRADNPDTWATWFKQLGLARSITLEKMPTGLAFTDDVSLIEAAVEGLGIALLRSRLIERELLTKRLVPLLPHRLKTTYAYYIVTPSNIKLSEQVLCLMDWLRSEAMK